MDKETGGQRLGSTVTSQKFPKGNYYLRLSMTNILLIVIINHSEYFEQNDFVFVHIHIFNQEGLINKNTNFTNPLQMVAIQRKVYYKAFSELGLILKMHIEIMDTG